VWQHMFGSRPERTPTLLVGHSMGGALAVWTASTKHISGLEGVVVIDVVEGTALGETAQLTHFLSEVWHGALGYPELIPRLKLVPCT